MFIASIPDSWRRATLTTIALAVMWLAMPAQAAEESTEALQKKCDAKDWATCEKLAYRYLLGEGVAKDARRGVGILAMACKGKFASACLSLGVQYQDSDNVPKDLVKANFFYSQACDLDDSLGCEFLAAAYVDGEGVTKNEERARDLYAKACRLGSDVACVMESVYAPEAKPEDAAQPSASELDTRCKAKDWAACNDLGLRYQKGEGVAKDLALAAALFGKACDGGHGSACHALAVLYDDDQGVARDAAKSAALLDRACKLGDLHVCPAPAAAAPSSAAPAAAAKPATGFAVLKMRLGSDTVASVERDIKSRGGSTSTSSGGLGKFTLNALSGDYPEVGPTLMAVNYDFDAAGPTGRLIAVTIVRKSLTGAPYATLVDARKAAIAKDVGLLQQKSATELTAQAAGVQASLFVNADTGYLYEVYRLLK